MVRIRAPLVHLLLLLLSCSWSTSSSSFSDSSPLAGRFKSMQKYLKYAIMNPGGFLTIQRNVCMLQPSGALPSM
jgi:hypothetical protein